MNRRKQLILFAVTLLGTSVTSVACADTSDFFRRLFWSANRDAGAESPTDA